MPMFECPQCPKIFYRTSASNAHKHMRDVHGYSSLDNLIDHREKNLTELEAKSAQLLEKYFGIIAEGKGNFVEKPPSLLIPKL